MHPSTRAPVALAMLALVRGQALILSAKGDSGTSLGLQVDPTNQADANIISQAEIEANIVNECGRTLLGGNIDIGEQTEIAIAAGDITQVTKGSDITTTISQRSADGAGPFTCDLDQTSNANGNSGQIPLQVTQSNSNSKTGDITIAVTMPADMACIGASTGDVCTVRCKNAANFGGCFAVQQTDTTPSQNTPQTIATAQTLDGVLKQVAQDQKDLGPAIEGIQAASSVDDQGVKVADALLVANPTLNAAVASASATPTAGKKKSGKGTAKQTSKGNRNKNNKRDHNVGLRWARRKVIE